MAPERECFYGGAAGGGKSEALLMAALCNVHIPGFAALLLRRTFRDLALPGALMDRAFSWLRGTDAKWSPVDCRWTFPSGATLQFGYLDGENDKYRYQSAEFQLIGFDELTQFTETQYLYLFSRLRRTKGFPVRLRMLAASNPGGVGHEWVRARFHLDEPDPVKRRALNRAEDRAVVPARLEDNPYLDLEEYGEALGRLDPVTRRQLRWGDWEVREKGALFDRAWFRVMEQTPAVVRKVRYWDLAATEPRPGMDPDWTVGALVGITDDGTVVVEDVRRVRATPHDVARLVRQTAELDGHGVPVWFEQEPGAASRHLLDYYRRMVVPGFAVYAHQPDRDKVSRAHPLASAAEAGLVVVRRAAWTAALLEEVELFPLGTHDDQVDALTGAYRALTSGGMVVQRRLPGY